MYKIIEKYKKWRLKNTFLLILSVIFLFLFVETSYFKSFIDFVGSLGYLGVFIAGIFFVSTFTVAPASIVLFYLAKELDLSLVVLFAGIGGMAGDYVIFRFFKDKVFEELEPIFMQLGGSYVSQIFSTPYFAWLGPVLGAIVIASPFPDEIGVGLLGIAKLKNWQFLTLSVILNCLGIFFMLSVANLF
ncbi:MAG: hypothetical protein QG594_2286 [Bacteroidota bacterium]|nr:hypothetical protein [Bacteroidota bacterium]